MFKRPTPKPFNIKTRYYNPEDEVRKRRNDKMKRQQEGYEYDPEGLRSELGYRWNLHRESKSSFNQKYTSFGRLIALAIIVGLIIITIVYLKAL